MCNFCNDEGDICNYCGNNIDGIIKFASTAAYKPTKLSDYEYYDSEEFRLNGKIDCPIGSNGLKYILFIIILFLIILLTSY